MQSESYAFNSPALETCEVEIKFIKTHPDAKLPSKAYSNGDNCFDLYCCEDTVVPPTTTTTAMVALSSLTPYGYAVRVGSALVPVGLKVAYITPGFGFVVKDKSGLGFKHQLSHYGGEIDNGYRGDMGIKIANYSDVPYTFLKGDKVAQIKVEKIWKTNISFTDKITDVECPRGDGGFGSSGK
jgi:deoxyuridine 5'-triphosphate nucleotidohydrolase